jgi:hypothetical protein
MQIGMAKISVQRLRFWNFPRKETFMSKSNSIFDRILLVHLSSTDQVRQPQTISDRVTQVRGLCMSQGAQQSITKEKSP